MDSLRVLLVHDGSIESDSVSDLLTSANHSVLPANGIEEATEILGSEQFDAVLLGSALASGSLARFAAQVRALDNSKEGGDALSHTPILSLSFAPPSAAFAIDAAIPPPFAASEFVAVVNDLARATPPESPSPKADPPKLCVLDVDELRAQVGYDDELMVEILDIFLGDWQGDLAAMQESLQGKDLPKLSRQAHTIKGSLSSLHAQTARFHAEALELAGGKQDGSSCEKLLPLLASDLEILAPVLQALRDAPHPA